MSAASALLSGTSPPVPAIAPAAVCIITQNESFGGMEVHTLGLMRALIERNCTIELVSNRYDRYDDLVREYGWQDHVTIIHTDLDGIRYGERSDRNGWRAVLAGLTSPTLVFPKGNYNFGQLGFLKECRRAFRRIVFIEHLEPYDRPAAVTLRNCIRLKPGLGLWWQRRRVLSQLGSTYADSIVAVSAQVRDRLVQDIAAIRIWRSFTPLCNLSTAVITLWVPVIQATIWLWRTHFTFWRGEIQ